MQPIVSKEEDKNRRLTNRDSVILQLALSGQKSKYELSKQTNLAYPRVHEAITYLETNGLVYAAAEELALNKLPSRKFSLTFKGALTYLSLEELEHPKTVWTNNESEEDIKKEYRMLATAYIKGLINIKKALKLIGYQLKFPVFQEIDWLEDIFGVYIYDLILEVAKNQKLSQNNFFSATRHQYEEKKQRLEDSITCMKKYPYFQKAIAISDDGVERKETELDLLQRDKSELALMVDLIGASITSENEYWKNVFADAFFELIANLPKKKTGRNEALTMLAENRMQARKKTLHSLEKSINKLNGDA